MTKTPPVHLISAELSSFAENLCNTNKTNSRNAKSMIGRNDEVLSGDDSVKKSFPRCLHKFLQLIPGNNVCPDCELRTKRERTSNVNFKPSNNDDLLWANIEYGTIICEECAGCHIKMHKMTSSIMSLESSNWRLPQLLSLLEGGNRNFLNTFNQVEQDNHLLSRSSSRSLMSNSSRRLRNNIVGRLGPQRSIRGLISFELPQEDNYQSSSLEKGKSDRENSSFYSRYKENFRVEMYKTKLSSKVIEACRIYGGAKLQYCDNSVISESDFNDGSSLATLLAHKGKQGTLTIEWTKLLREQPRPQKSNATFDVKKNELSQFPPHHEFPHSNGDMELSRSVHNFFVRVGNEENNDGPIDQVITLGDSRSHDDQDDLSTVCTYSRERFRDQDLSRCEEDDDLSTVCTYTKRHSEDKKLVSEQVKFVNNQYDVKSKMLTNQSKQKSHSSILKKNLKYSSRTDLFAEEKIHSNETYSNHFVKDQPFAHQLVERRFPQLRRDRVDNVSTNKPHVMRERNFDYARSSIIAPRRREYFTRAA